MKHLKCFSVLAFAGILQATCSAATSALTGWDSGGTTTLTAAQYWSGGISPTVDSAEVAETDFVVLNVGSFRMPGGTTTFKGKSMRWGTATSRASGFLKGGPLTFENDGLVLVNGVIGNWIGGVTTTLNGPVTVALEGTSVFQINSSQTQPSTQLAITGPVRCANAGDTLRVCREMTTAPLYTVTFSGDFSEFFGTLEVAGKTTVNMGTTTVAGRVSVAADGTFGAREATDVVSVKTLTLVDGSILKVAAGSGVDEGGTTVPKMSRIRVTEVFSCPTDARIQLTFQGSPSLECNQDSRRHVLFSVPKGTGLVADRFELPTDVMGDAGSSFLPRAQALEVVEEGDEELLCLTTRRIATDNVASEGYGQSIFLPAYANHWTGHAVGDELNPEWDYFVDNCVARSPEVTTYTEYSFAGHSLTFWRGTLALKALCRITVLDLTSVGCSFSHWGGTVVADDRYPFAIGGVCTLAGRLRVATASGNVQTQFSADSARLLRFETQLHGSGDITYLINKGNASAVFPNGAAPAYLDLAGDNTGFTGRITVKTNTGRDADGVVVMPTDEARATLIVTDGRNLGGPCTSFTFDALRLQAYGTLRARADVALAEPTRGIFVSDVGQFEVDDGCTLAIAEQLTLQGRIAKFGAGTLALGGRLAFGSASVYTPGEKVYPLAVKKGGLKAVSVDGANGLSVTFAAGAKLLLDRAATGDVATYGLRNVLAATPFAAEGTEGVLVALEDVGTEPSGSELTVPVCTVSASAADTVGSLLRLERPWSNWEAKLSRQIVDDGTVTFVATYRRTGFMFIVR